MTKEEKEEFDQKIMEYEKIYGKLSVIEDNIDTMPDGASLMHPLPRKGEISSDVDLNPKADYFPQSDNGPYVRMALLDLLNRNKGRKA